MSTVPSATEIYIQPGEFRFGDRATRLLTLLGSCVAVTFWHPTRHIGGMCHFMLPTRGKSSPELDGRYGDEAIELMMRQALHEKTDPKDYHVKMFGGGQMFDVVSKEALHVGARNVEAARRLIAHHGLQLIAESVGGVGHRNIRFDIWSGDVWVRQVPYQRIPPS